MRFLDVKTDYAFKKVFGSEQSVPILISFLNSLISFPKESKIESLTIVDPYSIPKIKGMKDTYVDVKATLEDKTTVIIEMQVLNVESFEKRVLYNAAKQYSVQLVKGDDYSLLNPVIALTIVDFDMFPDTEKVINSFKLLEKEKLIEYTNDIELVFVELPKFTKDLSQLENITDKWIYFLKNAGSLEYIPEIMGNELKKAFEIINEAGMTTEELEVQHKRHDFIYLQKSSVVKGTRLGYEQGVKQGIKQGIEQGENKTNLNIAAKMIIRGDSNSDISELTGMPIDAIEKLRE